TSKPRKSPSIHYMCLSDRVLLCMEITHVLEGIECWQVLLDTNAASCLVASQRPLVHLLRLAQLALVRVEVAQVVDRLQCRRVVGPECLLETSQRPLVHLLRLAQLALVEVENAQHMHSIENCLSLLVLVDVSIATSLRS